MSHRCPINGCTTIIADQLAMCGEHWRIVPQRLALPLVSKWNDLQRIKRTCKNSKLLLRVSADYANALNAVVAHVDKALEGMRA